MLRSTQTHHMKAGDLLHTDIVTIVHRDAGADRVRTFGACAGVNNGGKQGDPLFSLLYIIAMEVIRISSCVAPVSTLSGPLVASALTVIWISDWA